MGQDRDTKEFDKIIAQSMNRSSKFANGHEKYYPEESSYRYGEIEENLAGRIITERGLKYPFEIFSEDSPLKLLGNDESDPYE